jgi:hypothetical protein
MLSISTIMLKQDPLKLQSGPTNKTLSTCTAYRCPPPLPPQLGLTWGR